MKINQYTMDFQLCFSECTELLNEPALQEIYDITFVNGTKVEYEYPDLVDLDVLTKYKENCGGDFALSVQSIDNVAITDLVQVSKLSS